MQRGANRFARLGLEYAPFRAPAGMDWQDVAQQRKRQAMERAGASVAA